MGMIVTLTTKKRHPVLAVNRTCLAAAVFLSVLLSASPALAHRAYVMVDNHTDYNWNATGAEYDRVMLRELDYYLRQVDATAGSPPQEQSRYVADSWWYLYLYEHNRSPEQFADLIAKIHSGHITVPINPFAMLYGAMSTEMTIRAGYYPGRIAAEHGIEFLLTYPSVENATIPWGIASIFAGSGARYAWKGVCACVDLAPHDDVPAELFRWRGPDQRELLMKWYRYQGDNQGRGGYAEALTNLSVGALEDQIDQTRDDMPGISVTGLFGVGWDDVLYESMDVVDTVKAFNASSQTDQAIVSNGIDFFRDLEASGEAAALPVLRGGFGNDWDMWPITLSETTARQRRALERLRTAELLGAVVEWADPGFWTPISETLEAGLTSTWKYFEHSWSVTPSGPSLEQMKNDKEAWTLDIEIAVAAALSEAESRVARLFTSKRDDEVVVFNPLDFERTGTVDLPLADMRRYIVTDAETGREVPSQLMFMQGDPQLRWLASDVPSLGYRRYRVSAGTPSASWPQAGSIDTDNGVIENERYRVRLGTAGQIRSVLDKASDPPRELVGTRGMAHWGSGRLERVLAENAGAVSATLLLELTHPRREVRVTLYTGVPRVDVAVTVLENFSGLQSYLFDTALEKPQIYFEEVGAIARPGLIDQGGDFIPGTRANRMTLNHSAAFSEPGYSLVLSNADAFAMQVGNSRNARFDLSRPRIEVIISDTPPGGQVDDQGGNEFFLHRFALQGQPQAFSGAAAMRASLAHQNPLHAVRIERKHDGPLTDNLGSFLSHDASGVVVTAFKPAEGDAEGLVVRAWELDGRDTRLALQTGKVAVDSAHEVTLIENALHDLPVNGSEGLAVDMGANELRTWRIVPAPPGRNN